MRPEPDPLMGQVHKLNMLNNRKTCELVVHFNSSQHHISQMSFVITGFSVGAVTPATGVTGKCYSFKVLRPLGRSIDLSNSNEKNDFLNKLLCKLLAVTVLIRL